jgi:hypothetical protein
LHALGAASMRALVCSRCSDSDASCAEPSRDIESSYPRLATPTPTQPTSTRCHPGPWVPGLVSGAVRRRSLVPGPRTRNEASRGPALAHLGLRVCKHMARPDKSQSGAGCLPRTPTPAQAPTRPCTHAQASAALARRRRRVHGGARRVRLVLRLCLGYQAGTRRPWPGSCVDASSRCMRRRGVRRGPLCRTHEPTAARGRLRHYKRITARGPPASPAGRLCRHGRAMAEPAGRGFEGTRARAWCVRV